MLDPSAGSEVGVDLTIGIRPVAYAARQAADVYEVEVIRGVRPFTACVVDFEGQVRRRGCIQYRAEICRCNLGIWEVVGNVDGP
jgi:hypothetical protein